MDRRPRVGLGRIAVLVAVLPGLAAAATEPGSNRAQPCEVVASSLRITDEGRRCLRLDVVAQSTTFEEHAHTLIRAARDAQEVSRADFVSVLVYASRDLVGLGPPSAHGFYAPDGRAGAELPGADPGYRMQWRVFAAERAPTEQELRIAALWKRWAPLFPSRDPLSSCATDVSGLRKRIAGKLGVPVDDVVLPVLPMHLFLELRPS